MTGRRIRDLEYLLPLTLFTMLALLSYVCSVAFHTQNESTELINHLIGSFHWVDPTKDVNAATRELAGRYLIQADYLLVFFAALMGGLYSASMVVSVRRCLTIQRYAIISALVAISFYISYKVLVSSWDPFWSLSLTGNLTTQASLRANFARFDQLSTWISELTIASLCLSGAAISVLIATEPKNPQQLREKVVSKTRLLYLNAFLLVVFSVSDVCELVWVASLLPQGDRSEAYYVIRLAVSAAVSAGVYNTLMIAGIYGPGFLVLARQAMKLANDELPSASHKEKRDFLAKNGLSASAYETTTKTLAVFSPLLAAVPLANLLTYLFR